MIRTYRTGTQIPSYVFKILFELFTTGISMMATTQNLRKRIQQNSQLTHIELLQLYRKNANRRDTLFYFINGSTDNQSEYDFTIQQLDYLVIHVKGNCQLEQIQDHHLKQILCPLDMNFQKTFSKTFLSQNKNKTQYNRTQFYDRTDNKFKQTYDNNAKVSNQNTDISNKTVNFLNTNYQQTYKNFRSNQQPSNLRVTRDNNNKFSATNGEFNMFDLQENVKTKPPTPMNIYHSKYAKQISRQQQNSKYQNTKISNASNPINLFNNLIKPSNNRQQINSNNNNNRASYDSSVLPNNLYIQKFAKVPTGDGSYAKKMQLNDFLSNRKKQQFQDDFNQNNKSQYSDYSRGSAFLQY